MATTYEAIATVTVGSGGASSIEFSSIPATYSDICLLLSLRNNRSTAIGYPRLTVNSSTSGYTRRELYGDGSGAYSTSAGAGSYLEFVCSASGATSSTFGNATFYIPNYAGSSNKSISYDAVSENNATTAQASLSAGFWSNTNAITSITIAPGDSATSFSQYSTATLYGIKNS